MKNINIIWIASYPRSGNTFLRTILWQCFGLRSASMYPNDLGGNKKLEQYVGHIERKESESLRFTDNGIPLIKTHEYSRDNYPAIYVIRDGRAACVSLWQFYRGQFSLNSFIEGQQRFGSWSDHVQSWDPWNRTNTLLLKYEDMVNNLPIVLNSLSEYLNREIKTNIIPDRNTIAGIDGQWVKTKKNWESEMSGIQLQRFNMLNEEPLKKGGYLS